MKKMAIARDRTFKVYLNKYCILLRKFQAIFIERTRSRGTLPCQSLKNSLQNLNC
ncbi:hypothetical protein CKA32_002068 [Geitlerinema sp. FC II]|nr:hypothetical protein CKA32_002068 [Geitlerinema sp. FC II]